MAVYSDIQTLISNTQNTNGQLTSLINTLQSPANLTCYDFKASQGGFVVNDGSIRALPRGAQSAWTVNVGWDAGPSSGTYGHECMIFKVFNPAITFWSFFLSWENLQGTVVVIIEGRYQGSKVYSQDRQLNILQNGINGKWVDLLSTPRTIDHIALISSQVSPNTNPPERITLTHFRLE